MPLSSRWRPVDTYFIFSSAKKKVPGKQKSGRMPTFLKKVSLISMRIISHSYIYSNATSTPAAGIDHTGEFPWDMKELLAQQDILAMPFPEECGGLGSSELAIVMAIEELSRHCATTGLLLAVQQLGSMPILLAGNEEQKRKYFPSLASGEWMAAFALTEAGSGSDAAAMRMTAVRRGDKYILNGSKRFITNGGIARVTSVFALTDPENGTRGISAFIVEKNFPGFSVGRI